MSATYELRVMLDSRGVRYTKYSAGRVRKTTWRDRAGRQVTYTEYTDSAVTQLRGVSPEQAVEVTLDREQTKLEMTADMEGIKCAACGHRLPYGTPLADVRYCMTCGRRVEP